MKWSIEITDECAAWLKGLTDEQWSLVAAAIDQLEESGPSLGRPFVDTLVSSRIPNLKELRPRHGNLRVLFVFDPRRTAILLFGGDKTGRWAAWYREAIPRAERLYEAYLAELSDEGVMP